MPFPDVKLANRPLHFLYLCDCSGSMAASGKMQALNQAIRQSLPGMAAVARDNPEARVLVRAVSFADRAAWHIETPTPVDQLEWRDLQAGGITAMGAALQLVAAALQTPPMEVRALPPVLVLISDGQPTDDFAAGKSFDVVLLVAIVLSVLTVVIESDPVLRVRHDRLFDVLEW
ncbi:VWA domain-containing protein, partial [Synechococcus sp. BA-120 BA3]|nr:VWA domain-containing protein [Synechococcus sp. BA-120 BA3]